MAQYFVTLKMKYAVTFNPDLKRCDELITFVNNIACCKQRLCVSVIHK